MEAAKKSTSDSEVRVGCPCCAGSGERGFECEACSGTGEARRAAGRGDDAGCAPWEADWCGASPRRPAAPERCPACGGRGHRWEPCLPCAGTGLLAADEAEMIRRQQHAEERARRRAAAEEDLRARAHRAWEAETRRLANGDPGGGHAGWRGWLLGFFIGESDEPHREHARREA